LGEKIQRHDVKVWLVNTGWTGGPFGVGKRMALPLTRAMVQAVLTHQLDTVSWRKDAWFGLDIPQECPGVPSEVLDPRNTWPEASQYDMQVRKLIAKFQSNFAQFEGCVTRSVLEAGLKNN
jgi:phosphoenolpyruvate carboxykinase (ATP)